MASRELEDFDNLLDRYGGLHDGAIREARRAIKDRRDLLLTIDGLKREIRDLHDKLDDERDAADRYKEHSEKRRDELQSLTKRLAGGQEASMLLTKAIQRDLRDRSSPSSSSASHSYQPPPPGQIQLHTVLYFNKTGLRETCIANEACTARQFDEFYLGFGASSPLVSVVDVGEMKEAADAKVREITKMFAFFPQTKAIYFGGGHDNGYATLLRSLGTHDLLAKVILIQTYKSGFPRDIASLKLSSFSVPEVFLETRLSSPAEVRRRGNAHYAQNRNVDVDEQGQGQGRAASRPPRPTGSKSARAKERLHQRIHSPRSAERKAASAKLRAHVLASSPSARASRRSPNRSPLANAHGHENGSGTVQNPNLQSILEYMARVRTKLGPQSVSYQKFTELVNQNKWMYKERWTNQERQQTYPIIRSLLAGYDDLINEFPVFFSNSSGSRPTAPLSSTENVTTPSRTAPKKSSASVSKGKGKGQDNAGMRTPRDKPLRNDYSGEYGTLHSGDEMDSWDEE